MDFTVESEKELVEKIYQALVPMMKAPFRVALLGDLGVGKTTLVRGLLEKLGIKEPVTSPTFTICKQYLIDSVKIQHLDLYRYSKDSKDSEIEEYIASPEAITFVEWPENLGYPLDNYNVVIFMEVLSEYGRKVSIKWN